MGKWFLSVLFWLTAGLAVAQEYTFERGIAYRDGDDYVKKMCRLDVASKPGAKDVPVIVWFHGGGLTGGGRHVPGELLGKDYVVVGAGYRFASQVPVKEIIDDAAAAVAWTFRNAARYGGDPSRIYIAGHSAGGYLVDMIGLDRHYLAGYGISADSLAAIVPYSGQAITHFAHRETLGMSPLQPLVDSLAPLYHVRGDAPPMLIISGDREKELYGRCEETAYFWRMLKLSGHKDLAFYELDGFDHGSMVSPGHQLLVKYIEERRKTDDAKQ